ncbi:formate dehydrogenase accessory sulfurtransferase FdhD [Rhodoplanes sp. SY1]|uniref:formate dehydrogenase accessory sulfurtransferase FdhD n=1 Tax=Rhodoplanes sp. SY1 TaxID=3166646 RepID=UPI0038B620E1
MRRVVSVAHGREPPAAGHRTVPEETAVALVYGGSTEAVMMATPADLADFGIGFSLTEGIVTSRDEIEDLAIVPGPSGVEVRMWLAGARAESQARRRRRLAGPTGCGLCGIESLDEACRPVRAVSDHLDRDGVTFDGATIAAAVAALASAQHLQHATHATHAAGFFSPEDGLVALREDVGRHNALDKLAGTLARNGVSAASGAVVITSRVSVEMVQKTAAIGAPVLIAVSAPTALAVRVAAAAGVTLVAMARGASFEVYSHPQRIG